jgi:hypothetical protein
MSYLQIAIVYGMKVWKGTIELTSDELIIIYSLLDDDTTELLYRVRNAKDGKPNRVYGHILHNNNTEFKKW